MDPDWTVRVRVFGHRGRRPLPGAVVLRVLADLPARTDPPGPTCGRTSPPELLVRCFLKDPEASLAAVPGFHAPPGRRQPAERIEAPLTDPEAGRARGGQPGTAGRAEATRRCRSSG
ncbi:hypothetical protein GCM10007977_108260 [Dactylosporangium sucinum]|uniref:Uncharacterized protein n=1 Tax=Dactylosporangium sucinum TaxID=1424081 RepID=A0A917UGB6_9ACTN|nr:hypothetical protein GCM10007977_108260 [Dactylosporangium sucinum]